MPGAKFESSNLSSFGDMTSQNFPFLRRTKELSNSDIYAWKCVNFEKKEDFYVQSYSLPLKIDPPQN